MVSAASPRGADRSYRHGKPYQLDASIFRASFERVVRILRPRSAKARRGQPICADCISLYKSSCRVDAATPTAHNAQSENRSELLVHAGLAPAPRALRDSAYRASISQVFDRVARQQRLLRIDWCVGRPRERNVFVNSGSRPRSPLRPSFGQHPPDVFADSEFVASMLHRRSKLSASVSD